MIFTIPIIIVFVILLIVCITILIGLKARISQQKKEQEKLIENCQHYTQKTILLVSELEKKKEEKNLLIQIIGQKAEEKNKITNEVENRTKELERISNLYNTKNIEYEELKNKILETKKQADQIYEEEKWKINNRVRQFKKTAEESANYFVDNLEKVYATAEAGHVEKMSRLQEELDGAAADLQKLQETRKAAHEALLKQRQIKENKDNYRLLPSSIDLQDIYALEHIKKGLHKPRILSMLIWQTYFQPLAKEKFPVILQDKTKIGVYKITNIHTDQCYIGQSVDIYKRWSDHCKAGLGIDAPVGNKLYKSMQEEGLQNFTFELLCECPKQELDEKEKYFISLYQSDLYGFNSTKGNK